MSNAEEVNVLYAATTDFLPLATVSAISAYKNLKPGITLNVYFLYADIVKEIDKTVFKNTFETAKATFDEYGINFIPMDVKDLMPLMKGQNYGLWGEAVSMTHYIYLLAPIVLNRVGKVIYLDTDMIVNCDLSVVFNQDMENCLIGMGAPRGMEEMGDDVSNSGFVVLNLDLWKKENTLETLLEFGRQLPRGRFCDQYLLYEYFTKRNPNRLYLFDKEYNIFPQLFEDIHISDIKILHFTGWKCRKPWGQNVICQRASYLWWKYARETYFYEYFILRNIKTKPAEKKLSLGEKIFSIRNSADKRHKVVNLFNVKLKFKRKETKGKPNSPCKIYHRAKTKVEIYNR